MQINDLDPKKYKRFFAFGCSCTNYKWPTWADIIGQDIEFYENWAEPGAGNSFIFNSVIEAHSRYNFNKDDLVIILWSTKNREDRYLDNKWTHATVSNIEKTYGRAWVEKFFLEDRHYLIRDLVQIKATHLILDSLECDWASLTLMPLFNGDANTLKFINDPIINKPTKLKRWFDTIVNKIYKGNLAAGVRHQDVVDLYKDVFTRLNGDYEAYSHSFAHTRTLIDNDEHPTPVEALGFLDFVWPNNSLSASAREYAETWNKTLPHTTKTITRL